MIGNSLLDIEFVGRPDCLWRCTVKDSGRSFDFSPPVFEVDGAPRAAAALARVGEPARLGNGVTEYGLAGPFVDAPELSLEMILRVADDNPVVRIRYVLHGPRDCHLTRTTGRDALTYLGASFAQLPQCQEARLAEFNEMVHSYCPAETEVAPRQFDNGLTLMGPILTGTDGDHSLLLAYEHGSQAPDAFLHFALGAGRSVTLRAVKGNYCDGQPADGFQTPWLQAAAVRGGGAALASAYRDFVLRSLSANAESRKPYVFYNTWNFQERNKWWNGRPYLESMTQERIEAEIDVAHRMGIDVFVLDTGWYEKTGDWQVNRRRFPDGLRSVKAKLDGCGMKLGLWFDPLAAAVSSRMFQEHQDCRITRDGKAGDPHEVWETEASHRLCLVSRYADAFADELIRLAREVGVTYFKWDAIGQYGCDDPHHDHGTDANTPQERADSYAFQLGLSMARIVDKLCAACPQAIVDFDVTEAGRCVGLGFLSAGKYFLINNGPYYRSLDDPASEPGGGMGSNVFVFPGPARARICRAPLGFDRWIPSVLFLTHYLPDDPAESQWVNLASLVLGQNGLWGDLLNVSDEGIARIGQTLARYKQVRDDITRAAPVRQGAVGGSPEVHEKIDAQTGRGVVSVFAGARGRYAYVTQNAVAPDFWHNDGVSVSLDSAGRARIEMDFDRASAKIVFFGAGGQRGII